MLPLRLRMENFGSFREPTTVDFTDADYFALVGPTGAGKSTVIDAICFALYGTVPRWGRENVVSFALAPSATTGRVGLVFGTGGRRYATVRVLARSARGRVGTKEARLDELDPTVSIDADLTEVMEAVVRPLAEGPDLVTAEVERLTGLEYRYFTQCVVLPQGKFHEFLHAAPKDRQDLLVQLLDAGVYDRIRARAVREEESARQEAALARDQLDRLTDADEAAERNAEERLQTLRTLADEVRARLRTLRGHDDAVRTTREELEAARRGLAALDAVTMPDDVPGLAEEIHAADREAAEAAEKVTRAEADEAAAQGRLAELGDKAALAQALHAHRERERLTSDLAGQETQARTAAEEATDVAARVRAAHDELAAAQEQRDRLRDLHAAADLAGRLAAGEPCPVCLRPVTDVPHHAAPADLDDAVRDVQRKQDGLDRQRETHQRATVTAERLQQVCEGTRGRLAELAPRIEAHPDREAVEGRLAEIDAAEQQVEAARAALRTHRVDRQRVERRADELRRKAEQAWRDLDAARDTVVALGAPPLDRDDLRRAWTALLDWRDRAAADRRNAVATLAERLADAERTRDGERDVLLARLDDDGVRVPPDASADAVDRAVTTALARAEAHLERVRENRERARGLVERADESEQHTRVAHGLALLLKANNFERWLCGEALELLLAAGSETLHDLSGGQYELVLNDKGDIEVVDYREAGMRRSVRTLSGGETFQASLALALALSSRVAGLSAAATRSLDSIFLDEGFGTLDPATLDTVAATLERLAAGDRMVGIVTHVPALAEQVPVRFQVTRDDRGSHLTKVTT